MARGEFKAAMELRPRKASDFTDLDEVRKHLVSIFNESRRENLNSTLLLLEFEGILLAGRDVELPL